MCRQAYFQRLRKELDSETYTKVDYITEDGLYIGKRAIRGAQGQGDLLNPAGTVLYHTVLYIKANGKVSSPGTASLFLTAFVHLLASS